MSGLKWDMAFAMEQAADDKELLQELLEIFKNSLQSDVRLIEQGLAEEAPAKVYGAAHSIKGASSSLGIVGIQEIALQIETDSRAGNLETARVKLPDLLALMQEVLEL